MLGRWNWSCRVGEEGGMKLEEGSNAREMRYLVFTGRTHISRVPRSGSPSVASDAFHRQGLALNAPLSIKPQSALGHAT